MNQLRRVGVYFDTDVTLRDPDWEGLFHGFGLAYEYYRVGEDPQVVTTAIIERADGTVVLVQPDYIRFLDRTVIEKEVD
jgi:hypothetical protein